jgi:hypothetical protein
MVCCSLRKKGKVGPLQSTFYLGPRVPSFWSRLDKKESVTRPTPPSPCPPAAERGDDDESMMAGQDRPFHMGNHPRPVHRAPPSWTANSEATPSSCPTRYSRRIKPHAYNRLPVLDNLQERRKDKIRLSSSTVSPPARPSTRHQPLHRPLIARVADQFVVICYESQV